MTETFFSLVTDRATPTQNLDLGKGRRHQFVRRPPVSLGTAFSPVTASAKAGLETLAKVLAIQLAARRRPGQHRSPPATTRKDAAGHSGITADAWKHAEEITPMGRLAEPDDIAAAIAFLLSRDAPPRDRPDSLRRWRPVANLEPRPRAAGFFRTVRDRRTEASRSTSSAAVVSPSTTTASAPNRRAWPMTVSSETRTTTRASGDKERMIRTTSSAASKSGGATQIAWARSSPAARRTSGRVASPK